MKMTFNQMMNLVYKESVYDIYLRLFADRAKQYDRITKKAMISEILKELTPEKIVAVCTARELKLLEKLLKNDEEEAKEIEQNKQKYIFELEELTKKGICFYTYIYEEFAEAAKKALEIVDWKKKRKEEELISYLVGYVRAGSIVQPTMVNALTQAITNREYDYDNYVKNNAMFNCYVVYYSNYINEKGYNFPALVYLDDIQIVEDITDCRRKYKMVTPDLLSPKAYRSIFYNGYDENDKKIKDFFDIVNQNESWDLLRKELLTNVAFNEPIISDETLKNDYKLSDDDIKKWKKVKERMPSAAINGLTFKAYKAAIKLEELTNEIKRQNVNQGNARIAIKDAGRFLRIYYDLLDYTNKRYNIHKGLSIEWGYSRNPEKVDPIIEKFWQNKEKLIDDYLAAHPNLSNSDKKAIRDFKYGYRSEFILFRYERSYSVFINDDDEVFMVKGLSKNIDFLIQKEKLPILVKTAILPFSNSIIYDGIISAYPISIGPNKIKRLYSTYEKQEKIYTLTEPLGH